VGTARLTRGRRPGYAAKGQLTAKCEDLMLAGHYPDRSMQLGRQPAKKPETPHLGKRPCGGVRAWLAGMTTGTKDSRPPHPHRAYARRDRSGQRLAVGLERVSEPRAAWLHDGDSDSTGAMCGFLLGAALGLEQAGATCASCLRS